MEGDLQDGKCVAWGFQEIHNQLYLKRIQIIYMQNKISKSENPESERLRLFNHLL